MIIGNTQSLLPGDLDHLTMKRYIRKICILIIIIIINHCIPQANVQNVELVKGMGVMLPATMLASAIRRGKRNPTLLLRKEIFPPDILKISTVRGRNGLSPLDGDVMETIFCTLKHRHRH